MSLLYFKALHLIGVIVWFAGLFYLGRLFVYHREADERAEPERGALKAQFALMEKRLYYGITWPGLCITIFFGSVMLMEWGLPTWILTKIGLVVLLVLYHLWCGHLRKKLLHEKCGWSGKQFRLFNEIPTLLLVIIVFLVVFKEAFSWSIFYLILAGLILTIGLTVQLLAKKRQKDAAGKNQS
ncbi:MAG: protoporphyrinogen oxidase HemJ [Proteobacteria bacterium]|jgi:putative membrane protein|nr:protoporphyrinogen oxidase HemJ [Pseudomonadota bacterium]MBT5794265.1 protoporphyrinogen oxidase HemJ [Deltaproteobacteria bacterium]MDB3918058.1 protoporphyrinogen oxidase HemJ [bacterium]